MVQCSPWNYLGICCAELPSPPHAGKPRRRPLPRLRPSLRRRTGGGRPMRSTCMACRSQRCGPAHIEPCNAVILCVLVATIPLQCPEKAFTLDARFPPKSLSLTHAGASKGGGVYKSGSEGKLWHQGASANRAKYVCRVLCRSKGSQNGVCMAGPDWNPTLRALKLQRESDLVSQIWIWFHSVSLACPTWTSAAQSDSRGVLSACRKPRRLALRPNGRG